MKKKKEKISTIQYSILDFSVNIRGVEFEIEHWSNVNFKVISLFGICI